MSLFLFNFWFALKLESYLWKEQATLYSHLELSKPELGGSLDLSSHQRAGQYLKEKQEGMQAAFTGNGWSSMAATTLFIFLASLQPVLSSSSSYRRHFQPPTVWPEWCHLTTFSGFFSHNTKTLYLPLLQWNWKTSSSHWFSGIGMAIPQHNAVLMLWAYS